MLDCTSSYGTTGIFDESNQLIQPQGHNPHDATPSSSAIGIKPVCL